MTPQTDMDNVVDFDAYRKSRASTDTEPEAVSDMLESFKDLYRELPLMLTDDEITKICLTTMVKRGERDEGNLDRIIEWLGVGVLKYQIICMALNGKAVLEWDDEQQDVVVHAIDEDETSS